MNYIDGIIIDIENKTSFPGSVVIDDDRILEIKKADVYEILSDRFSKKLPYILPGFIDSHLHLDLTKVSPSEYARLAFSQGVVGAVVDCHDIVSVIGKNGLLTLIENSKNTPFYFGFSAPSRITNGYTVNDIAELLSMDEVTHLGEIKDFPSVILHEQYLEQLYNLAKKYNKPIDGYAPGVTRHNLIEYCKSPISTDHECYSYEDTLEKILAGLKVQIQTRTNFEFSQLKKIFEDYSENLMLCSQIIFGPNIPKGYLNKSVKQLINLDFDIFSVLKAACINPIKHYKLKTGCLKKGDYADFILVDSSYNFEVLKTYIKGKCVYDQNNIVKSELNLLKPVETIKSKFISQDDIKIISEKDFVDVNVINAVDDEINTVRSIFRMTVKNGLICSDTKQDILKTVLVDRKGVSKPSVAFVHGFGIKHGALAISISHDEHNLTSVGVKDKDIVVAMNRVIEIGGGFVYAIDGKVVAEIPLKFAGLISTLTAEELTEQFEKVRPIIRDKMKCTIKHPIHTLSYLSDIEIPSLKLSLKGLFNVPGQEFIDLVCRD